jgi:hypothetical protein
MGMVIVDFYDFKKDHLITLKVCCSDLYASIGPKANLLGSTETRALGPLGYSRMGLFPIGRWVQVERPISHGEHWMSEQPAQKQGPRLGRGMNCWTAQPSCEALIL